MTDRDTFMQAESYPVTLADGIVVDVKDDQSSFFDYTDHDESCDYVGLIVTDPQTGAQVDLWAIGIPEHWSGLDSRAHLWNAYLAGDGALLEIVRAERDRELAESAHAAACDIITVA